MGEKRALGNVGRLLKVASFSPVDDVDHSSVQGRCRERESIELPVVPGASGDSLVLSSWIEVAERDSFLVEMSPLPMRWLSPSLAFRELHVQSGCLASPECAQPTKALRQQVGQVRGSALKDLITLWLRKEVCSTRHVSLGDQCQPKKLKRSPVLEDQAPPSEEA